MRPIISRVALLVCVPMTGCCARSSEVALPLAPLIVLALLIVRRLHCVDLLLEWLGALACRALPAPAFTEQPVEPLLAFLEIVPWLLCEIPLGQLVYWIMLVWCVALLRDGCVCSRSLVPCSSSWECASHTPYRLARCSRPSRSPPPALCARFSCAISSASPLRPSAGNARSCSSSLPSCSIHEF